MWRWILGILAGVVLFVAAVAFAFQQMFSGFFGSVAKVIPKGRLERTTLTRHLGGVEAEAVVLRAGGWFVVTDMAAARDVPIFYWKKSFLYNLVGAGGCESEADAIGIEPLVAGSVYRAITSCAGEGTDIAGLTALGRPAEQYFTPALTLAKWQALDARVVDDPALFAANSKPTSTAFDYRCSFEFPFVWEAKAADSTYIMTRYQDAIEAKLANLLPGTHNLWVSSGYASTYVMYPDEGLETSIEGWAVETPYTFIARDGEERKVPGLSFYRPNVKVEGDAAACAAFGTMNFAPLWQGDRDMAAFEKAWAAGVAKPAPGGGALAWAELTGAQPSRTSPVQNLFDYRYLAVK